MPKEEIIIIIIIISGQNVAIIEKGQAVVVPQNNTPHIQRMQWSPIEYDIPIQECLSSTYGLLMVFLLCKEVHM